MLTRPDPTRQNPAKSWPDPTRGSIRPVDTGQLWDASAKVRMNGRESRAFNVRVGVHQAQFSAHCCSLTSSAWLGFLLLLLLLLILLLLLLLLMGVGSRGRRRRRRLGVTQGSWLEAYDSWLAAWGSRLMVHGSRLEQWALSLELWAASHEP